MEVSDFFVDVFDSSLITGQRLKKPFIYAAMNCQFFNQFFLHDALLLY